LGKTFEYIRASVNADNMVQLDIKVNVGTLNADSLFGNYQTINGALFESMISQYNNDNYQGAKETLGEINKLAFWQMIGVTQGSIEVEDGKLYGLKEYVEIDESLQAKINESEENKNEH
jgi:hypothetical protein